MELRTTIYFSIILKLSWTELEISPNVWSLETSIVILLNLPQTKKLKTQLLQFQLKQLIKKPTRLTETSRTLIDLAMTSHSEKIRKTGGQHLNISDHSLVYIVRQARPVKKPPRTITFRNYNRFSEDQFREDVKTLPLHVVEGIDDADTVWTTWKTMFSDICDEHAPSVTKTVRGD